MSNHAALRDPLQPCHLDVVGVEDVDDSGAHHPRRKGNPTEHQGRDRKDDALRRDVQRDSREDLPGECEEKDERDPDDKRRKRREHEDGGLQTSVEPRIPAERGRGSDRDREREHEDERHRQQHRGVPERRVDQTRHRQPAPGRLSEIAVDDSADPFHVADGDRPIEAVLVPKLREDRLVSRSLLEHGGRRVSREELHDGEDHDRRGEERREASCEADAHQPSHAPAALSAASSALITCLREPEVPHAVPAQEREDVRHDSMNSVRRRIERLDEVRDDVAAVVPLQTLRLGRVPLLLRPIGRRRGCVDETRRTMLLAVVPLRLFRVERSERLHPLGEERPVAP